jgi:transposase InsO family protein
MELAHQLMAPNGPYSKSQVVRALSFARGSLYLQRKMPIKDKQVAVAIEQWQELDDTLGHRKLAVLLGMGKNRVNRIMHKYGISARRKKKRYVYPGKTDHTAPNLVRELEHNSPTEIVFSDIFEVQLADRTRVRGCFALWKRTRHILALAFDYRMQAELVVSTIKMVPFEVPGAIFHSDQGKQYGAAQTRTLLLEKGFVRSMSRAGTPTDNGYAERFVGLFKLAVAERHPYRTLGDFLLAAQQWVNFYNSTRPHESLDYRSPDQFAQEQQLNSVPKISLF